MLNRIETCYLSNKQIHDYSIRERSYTRNEDIYLLIENELGAFGIEDKVEVTTLRWVARSPL